MQRNFIRFIIDVLQYQIVCCVASVGLILAFVLTKGPGGKKEFLGLHRHDWQEIHLVFSIIMLVLLVVHIWLNWRWILQVSLRLFEERRRGVLILIGMGWLGLLFLAWLVAML